MNTAARITLSIILAALCLGHPFRLMAGDPHATRSTGGSGADAGVTPEMLAADVRIAQVIEPATVYAGERITITITVTNHGPLDADSVVVTDALPAGVTYAFTMVGCVNAAPCALGTIPAGESRQVVLKMQVDPNVAPHSLLTNRAAAQWRVNGGELQWVESLADLTILEEADLAISQYGPADGLIHAGEPLTITLAVDNDGPSDAHAVTLASLIGSSGPFDLVSIDSDRPADCAPEPGPVAAQVDLACTLEDPLPRHRRWVVCVTLSAAGDRTVNGSATVSGAGIDPDPANNATAEMRSDAHIVDLRVTVDGPEVAWAGQGEYAYTIEVYDMSKATEAVARLVGDLPPEVDVTALTPSVGTCIVGAPGDPPNRLRCDLGDLAAWSPDKRSATVVVTFAVRPDTPPCQALIAELTVEGDGYDVAISNNRAAFQTTAIVETDLVVAITQTPRYVRPGSAIAWDVTVRNDGPCDALGATVEDVLPVGVAGAAWTCTPSDEAACPASGAGAVLRERVDLPAGSSLAYRIEAVRTPAGAGRTLYNTVWAVPVPGALDYVDDNHATAVNVEYGVFLPLAGR